MSYEIEYNRQVYFDDRDKQKGGLGERNFLVLIRQGANNCRELNGLRVKDWHIISYGWNYTIIAKICERAGLCEGGSIQRANGFEASHITPENYLILYRQKIKNAKPITELLNDFDVRIMLFRKEKMTAKEKSQYSYQIKKIDEMIKKHNDYEKGEDYYHNEIKTYARKITTLKEFDEYLKLPQWNDNSICYNSFRLKKIK